MEVVFLGEIVQAWGRVESPIVSIYSIEPLVHPVTVMGGIQLTGFNWGIQLGDSTGGFNWGFN
jgi:hypothetical protein